jgi:hypothetical protein
LHTQFCFQQAQEVACGWQFPLVLGQVASKLQQPAWQPYCLRQYALACWQSRSQEECGAAYLQPFVKLHGMRLQLLAAAVAGVNAGVQGSSAAPTAAAGVRGTEAGSAGVLGELLGVLQLVGQWCFDPDVGVQLQPVLQQLIQQQQQLRPSLSEQEETLLRLQQLLQEPLTQRQLSEQLQQQQEQAPSEQLQQQQQQQQHVQLWRLAVELLVQDSSNALLECQACYMDPLAPARYSLAKGLYMLGRCADRVCCGCSVCGCVSCLYSIFCQHITACERGCTCLAGEQTVRAAVIFTHTARMCVAPVFYAAPTSISQLGQGAVHAWQVSRPCVLRLYSRIQRACVWRLFSMLRPPSYHSLAKGLYMLGR